MLSFGSVAIQEQPFDGVCKGEYHTVPARCEVLSLSPTKILGNTELRLVCVPFGGHIGVVFAQRAHSTNYYVVHPGNTPANYPPTEACMINSKQRRGCGIQGPGARGYRWWKTADFSHSAKCTPIVTICAQHGILPNHMNFPTCPCSEFRGGCCTAGAPLRVFAYFAWKQPHFPVHERAPPGSPEWRGAAWQNVFITASGTCSFKWY